MGAVVLQCASCDRSLLCGRALSDSVVLQANAARSDPGVAGREPDFAALRVFKEDLAGVDIPADELADIFLSTIPRDREGTSAFMGVVAQLTSRMPGSNYKFDTNKDTGVLERA